MRQCPSTRTLRRTGGETLRIASSPSGRPTDPRVGPSLDGLPNPEPADAYDPRSVVLQPPFREAREASSPGGPTVQQSPWMTVREAARYVRCGPKVLYREIRAGRLRAARIGGRRELRIRSEWLDSWLEQKANVRDCAA
jgi:excisionase family DNA binding protein